MDVHLYESGMAQYPVHDGPAPFVCTTIVVVSNRAQQLRATRAASSYSRSDAGRY